MKSESDAYPPQTISRLEQRPHVGLLRSHYDDRKPGWFNAAPVALTFVLAVLQGKQAREVTIMQLHMRSNPSQYFQ